MDAGKVEAGAAAVERALDEAIAVRGGARPGPGPAQRLLAPGELLASMAPALAAEAAASPVLAGEDAAHDPALAERIRALIGHASPFDERRSIECQDPLAVARAGLAIFRDVPDSWDVGATITWALGALVDRSPLRAAMLGLWSGAAPYQGYWQRLSRVLEPAASDPGLAAALAAIALDDAGDADRRRAAIELLGHARGAIAPRHARSAGDDGNTMAPRHARSAGDDGSAGDDALAVLVLRARRDRDRTTDDARWRDATIEALGRLGRAEAVPTLVLELAAEPGVYWSHRVRALVAAAGDDALPWLRRAFACPRAAEAVVDGLEHVPAARDWLHELAADPEPRFRLDAVRALVRRGDAELPYVAAIWKSLDAIGYETGAYAREDALEKLGAATRTGPADWDALLRARGLTAPDVPPVPDIVESLTLLDDRRVMAIERLGWTPDPGALLALVLALEVYEALRRRGDRPPLSSPRWRDWAAAVPAWPFADGWMLTEEMSAWVRAHRAELPPQRLTAALQRVLDEGADAIAAAEPDPRFALAAAERIAFDTAERAIIAAWEARHGSGTGTGTGTEMSTGIGVDAADLFGVVLERAPVRIAPAPRAAPAALLPGSATGDVLTVPDGGATLSIDRSGSPYHYLAFDVTVENRLPRPVKLLALEVALRDGGGHLVDHARRVQRAQLWHHGELSENLLFVEGSFDRARSVDLLVTHEVGFRRRVVVADLVPDGGAPLTARAPWPHTPATLAPGYPDVDASLSVFRPGARHLRCEAVLELRSRTPLREPTAVQVLFVLRNAGGSIVERTLEDAVLDPTGPVFVHADRLGLTQETLRTARRLEVAVAGIIRRTERLAGFLLP
jgi:hypothetical protein